MKKGLRTTEKADGLNQYFVEDYTVNFLKMETKPIPQKVQPVPQAWKDAIAYNEKHVIFSKWLVYELGFLSEDRHRIQKVISIGEKGNDFTWLVYSAQKYLSKYYSSVEVNGKLDASTTKAMFEWSRSTINFNQKHISPEDFEWIKQKLLKVVMPGHYRYLYSDLQYVNTAKGVGNKEFSWLVLSVQRVLMPFGEDNGKLDPATRKVVESVANDLSENYTIFVNGLVGIGSPPAVEGKEYWRGGADKNGPDQFIKAAEAYLSDGKTGIHETYSNGSNGSTSTAETRQEHGRTKGKRLASTLLQKFRNPDLEIKEINFVTHSMGAATAEGMIEEFMKHKVLASLLEKGEIIHFSAADADKIVISKNSRHLRRTQLNYKGDLTLQLADGGNVLERAAAQDQIDNDPLILTRKLEETVERTEKILNELGANKTGGYKIPGVTRFAVIEPNLEKAHNYFFKVNYRYDWHNETKWYKASWDFIKILDQKLKENPKLLGEAVFIKDE